MLLNTSLSLAISVCVMECVGSGRPHGLSEVCWFVASFSVVDDALRALRYLLSDWNRYWILFAVLAW